MKIHSERLKSAVCGQAKEQLQMMNKEKLDLLEEKGIGLGISKGKSYTSQSSVVLGR